jgi:hypothetical protein
MGLRSDDEGTGPHEVMDLLEQRGSLRRLVREALAHMREPEWKRRAEELLAMTNWQEYEVKSAPVVPPRAQVESRYAVRVGKEWDTGDNFSADWEYRDLHIIRHAAVARVHRLRAAGYRDVRLVHVLRRTR